MTVAVKMSKLVTKGKTRQMQMARKLKRSQAPRKPQKKRPPWSRISKAAFRKAIPDSGGLLSILAERLQVSYQTVYLCVRKDGWEDIRQLIQDEKDTVADLAEKTVKEMINQRTDYNVASTTARWLLTRARHKDRQMGDESKVVHEGGDKPIEIKGNNVPIETLDLPLEVKRQVLQALDRKVEEESKESR